MLASALTGEGIPEVWKVAQDFCATTRASGVLERRRRGQAIEWMHALIQENLRTRFYQSPGVRARLDALERAVGDGRLTALSAALELLGEMKVPA